MTNEPVYCDPMLFLEEKKYIPVISEDHVGIRQDINLRLSSPE